MSRYDEDPFGLGLSLQELTDASNECRHGRLPFDKGPRCSCWNIAWNPRPRQWQVPDAVRLRGVAMYESGLGFNQIAVELGVSWSAVRRWVIAARVDVRRPGRPRKAA